MKNQHKKLLEGIKVIDFSRILVGAYSSLMLADLGAEVIKVEPPLGDETRKWGPPFKGKDSVYYLSINRNKKSIGLDLKKPEAQIIAKRMIGDSDILIENYTFGKMKNFNLDYESVKETNKKLIYATVNSYGNKGPLKETPSFDLITQAYTGVMNITGGVNTEPFKVGYPMCDIMAGAHVYGGILAALYNRQLTGKGQYINTSLLETNIFAMPTIVSNYLNSSGNPGRKGNDHPSISPYTVFETKEGDFIAIGVATDYQFKKLCYVLQISCVECEKFKTNEIRLDLREELKEIIQKQIKLFEIDNLKNQFTETGIPFSTINSMKDLFDDNPQTKSLELVKSVQTKNYGELNYIRNPIGYSENELSQLESPPMFGEHTENILKDRLGFSLREVEKLYKNKVVF